MKAVLFAVALLAAVAAGSDAPPAEENPVLDPMQIDQMVVMHVQTEEMVSRRWLELVLKIQHAQYNTMAATMLMNTMQLEVEEKHRFATGYQYDSEFSDDTFLTSDFEEEEKDDDDFDMSLLEKASKTKKAKKATKKPTQLEQGYGTLWGGYNGMEDDKSNYSQDKLNLLADFYLFFAIKIRFAQTVYKIGDTQREFWMDRAMQLGVSAAGQQLPPQVYHILYMKVFRTYLETMKLSTALQMISNWIMWLEDGLDVYGAKVDMTNMYWDSVVEDQADDLIRDKMWAFSSYYQYAQLDFWVFYLDLYLEASLAPLLGGQGSFGSFGSFGPGAAPAPAEEPTAATALLEEEAEAEPTQTKSIGGNAAAGPYIFMKMFKWTHLLFQMMAAHSAQTAAYSEQLAFTKLDEGDYESSGNYRQFAQQSMSGFAQNLYQASNLEKWLAMWELYMMMLPFMAGSFGGDAGSFGGQGSLGANGSFGSF